MSQCRADGRIGIEKPLPWYQGNKRKPQQLVIDCTGDFLFIDTFEHSSTVHQARFIIGSERMQQQRSSVNDVQRSNSEYCVVYATMGLPLFIKQPNLSSGTMEHRGNPQSGRSATDSNHLPLKESMTSPPFTAPPVASSSTNSI